MTNETLRYFIYVRKSTGGEERQARSIDDQLAEIRELITKEKLEIVGSFEETQSAMSKGRPQFGDMLARIEAGEADGIIAWHPDRLARNAFDGGQVIDLIDQGKIRDLKFCTFWFEPTAQGKLMLNLAFGQSKYYSDSLSVNIRRGQRQKTKEGVWAWKAPVGYLNDPIKRTIVPDPAKAPLMKQAFELYATGKYTIIELCRVMNAAGLRGMSNNLMSPSRYQYFLKNPFYYGVFQLNGEMHEAVHEPLISKAVFDKVQEVMQRRSKPNTLRLKTYVYRGLLRCATCGCTITMETQKGHNYLRCTKRVVRDCPQPYAREELVTEQIAQALVTASIPDHWADWMVRELSQERQHGNDAGGDARKKLQAAIAALDLKLGRLTVAYLDAGAFSAAEFRRRKADMLGLKRKYLEDIETLQRNVESRFEPIIRFINGSKQRKYIASRAIPQELREELEKTGSNLKMDNRKLTWEARGASQLVVDQGRFAHRNTRAPVSGARVFGETGLPSTKWSDEEMNPTFPGFFLDQWQRYADYQAIAILPLLFIVWPWMTFVVLMLCGTSMRRARVRSIHVLRCILYSFDVALWVGPLVFIGFIGKAIHGNPTNMPGTFGGRVYGDSSFLNYVHATMAALLLIALWRLVVAYGRYLKFPHALATIAASQLILFMTLALFAINMDRAPLPIYWQHLMGF